MHRPFFTFTLIIFQAVAVSSASASEISWWGEAEVSYGYDSNVAVDDVDFSTSEGDQYRDLGLSGGIDYKTSSGFKFSLDLTASDKHYTTFDEFDGLLMFASAGVEKSVGEVTIDGSARYIDYQLDGEDFLTLEQLTAGVSWFTSKRTYVHVSAEAGSESFDVNPVRDNDEWKLGFLGYFFLNGFKQHLTLRIQYGEANADDALFDHRTRAVRLMYQREFENGASIGMGVRWEDRRYMAGVNPLIGSFRDDSRTRLELKGEWPLGDKGSVELKIADNDFDSNLVSAAYGQEIYQVKLAYRF